MVKCPGNFGCLVGTFAATITILTIVHQSEGKYPPLSPVLGWIIVLVHTIEAGLQQTKM